jgi:hypothetical protein
VRSSIAGFTAAAVIWLTADAGKPPDPEPAEVISAAWAEGLALRVAIGSVVTMRHSGMRI